MRIVVTNDDGIDGPGLRALVPGLVEAGHEVVVVAPDADYSGAGTSVLSQNPIEGAIAYKRRTLDEAPDVEAWAIGGPPARCALLAVREAFGPKPDMVVSGINFGLNTGPAILHSGTVGAAMTAARSGIPAVASSAQFDWEKGIDPDWETATAVTVALVEAMSGQTNRVASLNVPRLSLSDVRGVKAASPASVAGYRSFVESRTDDQLKMSFERVDPEPGSESDIGVVRDGWAAITLFDTGYEELAAEEVVSNTRVTGIASVA